MRTTTGLALAALLAASACGSTVQTTSTTTVGGSGLAPAGSGTGDGLGGGTSGAGGTTGGSAAGASTSTTGSSVGTSGSGSGAPGTGGTGPGAGGASGASLPASASTGLGVTAKTISIGVGYSTDGDAANAALGDTAFSQGDEKGQMQALIDEVNAHGGVAGRRLVPVFHPYHLTSADSGATQDQAACQDWTQDHKVIAVLSSSLTDTLVDCLQKKGVVYVKAGVIVDPDQHFLRQYSNEILLGTMSLDRIDRDQVSSFARQHWYTGWNTTTGSPGATTKVGVLTYDTPSFTRSLRGSLLPALRAAGHAPAEADVIQVHKVQQQADSAQTTAEIKSAVLRLQSDGVTHVVLGDASGFILQFFGSNARTQGYYPRLGVTSGAAPEAFYEAGLVTAQQLNGMSGNGWLPSLDIPAADADKLSNSETKRCLDILKRRTGQQFTSTNAATIALGDCDSVFVLQHALARATSLSPAGLVAGFDALAGTYTSPTVGPTRLTSGEHDAAVRAWDLNWVASCTCVRYSAERRVPAA